MWVGVGPDVLPVPSPKSQFQATIPLGTLATEEADPSNAVGEPGIGEPVVTARDTEGTSWVSAHPSAEFMA